MARYDLPIGGLRGKKPKLRKEEPSGWRWMNELVRSVRNDDTRPDISEVALESAISRHRRLVVNIINSGITSVCLHTDVENVICSEQVTVTQYDVDRYKFKIYKVLGVNKETLSVMLDKKGPFSAHMVLPIVDDPK